MKVSVIGLVVRQCRLERGWTLEVLSSFAGIDTSHLAKIERGEFIPHIDTFIKIAEALGMRPSQLMKKCEEEAQ